MGPDGSSRVIWWEEQETLGVERTDGTIGPLMTLGGLGETDWEGGVGITGMPSYVHRGSTVLYCATERSQNLRGKEMVVGVWRESTQSQLQYFVKLSSVRVLTSWVTENNVKTNNNKPFHSVQTNGEPQCTQPCGINHTYEKTAGLHISNKPSATNPQYQHSEINFFSRELLVFYPYSHINYCA